ncbi:MAG: hypothetical protein WBS19_19270, partial [Candidatus Korobacteraceae bacterium]
ASSCEVGSQRSPFSATQQYAGIMLMLVHAHAKRLPHSGFVQVRFEEVAPRQAEFGDIVTRVYKPVRAKHSQFVLVHDTLAIVADSEFSRYKDGTRSTGALLFLKGSYGTCRATAAR